MVEDLAAANVNRSYSLAATNIAIFTFMLIFLYPKFENATNQSTVVSIHVGCDGCIDVLTCVCELPLLPLLAWRSAE